MNRKQWITVAIVIVMLCVAGGAWYATSHSDDREVLVVETSPDFAPFDYTIGEEFVGIDMDIVRAVCNDMG